MMERTHDTLARASKGPIAPPPELADPLLALVAGTVARWPNVIQTVHWDLYDPSRVDGVDFYVGEDELGHIHLDGSIHLATNPALGKALIAQGLAKRFPYAQGWVQQRIRQIGADAAIALFRRNYERFIPSDARGLLG